MAVGINFDGRLEVFVRGNDNALWHCWQEKPAVGPWSDWERLGGPQIVSAPAVSLWHPAANGGGPATGLVVCAVGADGAMWYIFQVPAGGWGSWQSRGGSFAADPPAFAYNAFAGLHEVFLRGSDGQLWLTRETGNGGWDDFRALGGNLAGPAGLAHNQDGRTEAFAAMQDGTMHHAWMVDTNQAGNWSGFSFLAGPITQSAPAMITCSDGRIEGVFTGLNGEIRHLWQTSPNNGWAVQGTMGGTASAPAVISRNQGGRLEVFHVDPDGVLHNNWQTAPNNGWHGPVTMDAPPVRSNSRICVMRNANQALEVFAIGEADEVIHTWQQSPGAGPWSWGSLGPPGNGAAELGFRDAWNEGGFDT